MIQRTTAIIRNGQVELAGPLGWPDGTAVEVVPVSLPAARVDWFSLPPLDVGVFRELTGDDDLLAEMLDDSRD